jgi:hypothetical protein
VFGLSKTPEEDKVNYAKTFLRKAALTNFKAFEQSRNGKTFLLFVRERSEDENKVTMAFKFLGPLTYLSHEGSKPMSITWKLQYEPPAGLLNEGLKLAV